MLGVTAGGGGHVPLPPPPAESAPAITELSICVQLEWALMDLQRSVIELESSIIQFKSSLIRLTSLRYGNLLELESSPIQLNLRISWYAQYAQVIQEPPPPPHTLI